MHKKIPNLLTISRIIVIPIIILSFYVDVKSAFWSRVAAGLFMYACLTDFLDGYLARYYAIQSNLGRMLDPIADKLLIGAIIVVLVDVNRISIIPALAIICREILVSGLREFFAEWNISLPVTQLSKIKTAVQMLAILILILGNKGSNYPYAETIGQAIIWVAAILTIVTGYAYVRAGLRWLQY